MDSEEHRKRIVTTFTIAPEILVHFPHLNAEQCSAIAHTNWPLLVIAGPGSGKTLVLVLRTLNILLHGLAQPSELLITTFTEKSAYELRDRVAIAAKQLGYNGDLSSLRVGTIHGICNDFLQRYRQHTDLGNGYEVLDELTQLLFLNDHFDAIFGLAKDGLFLGHWKTRWSAIKGLQSYLDKITEECIDPEQLAQSSNEFLSAVGHAYVAYEQALLAANRLDFAHQEKIFSQLLDEPDVGAKIQQQISYIMVDEYQDTNYIQQQILLTLAGTRRNLCVVGDEDQSLYRFRGATVRNILEFRHHFDDCTTVVLETNYRSHRHIVDAYNRFMNSADWSNPAGVPFRYKKQIVPNLSQQHPTYPAVFAIWGTSKKDEAERFATCVQFLKEHGVIEDYSQVALLLRSVRIEHSGPYLDALADQGIPAFCPRARGYFDNQEVQDIVACFALLLGYYGDQRGELTGYALQALSTYVDSCIVGLGKRYGGDRPLAVLLREFVEEIEALREGAALDRRLGDYFYQFVAVEPFASAMQNENRARNLAIFSQLLSIFMNYYHYSVISHRNRQSLRYQFFNSFLRLLHEGGINEYEDPNQPFPQGHVQVMTIHQSKGLEFPAVFVGSLNSQPQTRKALDRQLAPFTHRAPFEPETRITEFDHRRLFYVAFSRAEKILVLTTTELPHAAFASIWEGLEQWPHVRKELLKAQHFALRDRIPIKKAFSFTSDLKVYETCPRQYQYFRYYDFTPSRSAEMFFGRLVHQTIEDIHRWVLAGQSLKLIENAIPGLLAANAQNLVALGLRPISRPQQEMALKQVQNYFRQNQPEMRRVIETEVDVSVEKEHYILTGKIDLLLGYDQKLELLDFKSQPRPAHDDARLDTYYKQLCIYAHILEQRYGRTPERLMLYWTGEERKADALMVFPYHREVITEAGVYFDQIVTQILQKNFAVARPPEQKVCLECDLRTFCIRQGTISAM